MKKALKIALFFIPVTFFSCSNIDITPQQNEENKEQQRKTSINEEEIGTDNWEGN